MPRQRQEHRRVDVQLRHAADEAMSETEENFAVVDDLALVGLAREDLGRVFAVAVRSGFSSGKSWVASLGVGVLRLWFRAGCLKKRNANLCPCSLTLSKSKHQAPANKPVHDWGIPSTRQDFGRCMLFITRSFTSVFFALCLSVNLRFFMIRR